MIINNYNPELSLSDYTIGNAYTFYVRNHNFDLLTIADEKAVKTYSSKLSEIINDNTYSKNDGKWLSFTRVIGVVVDKYKVNNSKDINKITVMFRTNDDRYVLNKYIVDSHDIFTNKKDDVPPAAVLYTA